jgi:hypothetical protein
MMRLAAPSPDVRRHRCCEQCSRPTATKPIAPLMSTRGMRHVVGGRSSVLAARSSQGSSDGDLRTNFHDTIGGNQKVLARVFGAAGEPDEIRSPRI